MAVLLVTSASAANRGVTFTGIGFHPNSGPYPYSSVVSMDPAGTFFMANPSYSGNYCIEWTREGGWGTQIGQSTSVCRISAEGTVMGTGVENLWNPIPADRAMARTAARTVPAPTRWSA